jgi:hypothetical protein
MRRVAGLQGPQPPEPGGLAALPSIAAGPFIAVTERKKKQLADLIIPTPEREARGPPVSNHIRYPFLATSA